MATISPRTAAGGIGESVLRKEDAEFVTGQARYVDDIRLPGMLHAAFVRSQYGAAKINGIDASAALELPGVVRVLTHDDLRLEGGVPCASNPGGTVRQPLRPVLATDTVRHVGEPIAMVLATDRYAARDGADAVLVDYDPLPTVVDAEAALEPDAPRVHEEYPDNLCTTLEHQTDGFEQAMASAPRRVTLRVMNQRLTPIAMETRGVVADWVRASGEVTLYTSTQVPHFVRTFVGVVCGTSEAKVRVVAPDVGGGFGSKLNTYAEEFAACAASRAVGAPVKWIEDRSENVVATIHGRDQLQHWEAGVDENGRVLALRFGAIQNNGAYLQLLTPSISHLTLFMVPGAYDIPQVSISIRQAFTNTTPTDAYRGAGRPEATHGVERLMDAIADDLGLDPADVRRRNFIQAFPYTTATGLAYDSGDYGKALDRALEMVDYAGFEARRKEASDRGAYRGIGLSTYVEVCGLAPSAVTAAIGIGAGGWESSTVRLHPTGKATVITGSSPHGQGHATSWSQIMQSELGVPFADVEVIHGDTAFAPYGLGTYGSRSLAVAGIAMHRSIGKIKEKARLLAAHLLECSADDLEWSDDRWLVKGSPDRAKTIQELGGAAWTAASLPEGMEPILEATTFHDPPNFTFPFGTHVAEVEIDGDTGRVSIERYVAVDDCGTVINPMIVDGQVHGGIVQSIAQALFEETVYAEDGQLRTPTLVEYGMPSAADLPHMELDRTTTPSPSNPLGVKGIGEAGTIAASAAVVNAAVDALSPLGIRHLDMPMQPARVWHAMREAVGGDPVIPVATEFTRAASLDEALAALRDGAKPIAGGQSLIPLMKLRLAAPEAIVDLGGLDELRGIRREGDVLVIGALTRHRELAESDELRAGCRVIAEAASGVGSPAVRNRGTIGGSLAHADPHADLPAALLALDGSVTVRNASGSRTIAAADLVVDYLQTSLADDELIVDVRVPADAGRSAYAKFHRRAIDWSIVGAAAVLRGDRVQVAVTGLGPKPVRATGFEEVVNGGGSLEDAARRGGEGTNPIDDLDGSSEYKRHLAGVLARRAVQAARER